MQFTPWPKIPSLNQFIKNNGTDQLLQPLMFTVKIHGTNAGILIDGKEVRAQSRTRLISPSHDNYGFAAWLESHEEWLLERYHMYKYSGTVTIFGEFAGRGIQQKVGVSEMEKFFYVFPGDTDSYDARDFSNHDKRFFRYHWLPNYLDFSTEDYLSTLNEHLESICDTIDKKCPFYQEITGKIGIGEGLVVYDAFNNPLFKVKGESHKVVSRMDKIKADVDPSILAEIAFADGERLSQVYNSFGEGRTLEPYQIPDYIKAVIDDIESEEGKLSPKAKKIIGNKAAQFLKLLLFKE